MRLILLPLLLLPALLTAQSILLAPRDARSQAAAGTGVANRGVAAVGVNPAGAGYGLEAAAGYERRYGLGEMGIASAAVAYRGGALLLASLNVDGYAETLVALSYRRDLSTRLRLGGRFGFLQRTTRGYGSQLDMATGLGLQYDLSTHLTVGLSALAISTGPPRLDRLQLGLSYQLNEGVTFSAEGSHAAGEGYLTRLGVTYQPVRPLTLYLGVITGLPELSFGVGWGLSEEIQATIAAGVHQYLGVSPFFGLAYTPRAHPEGAKPGRLTNRLMYTPAALQ
ncbi:hypothetical protein GGR26_001063 [Lewinella marina]|uniref:Uncharacterized protein n=1 Tax=Neolewinella marina TaxID=438751 RepID=A0A2G0CHX2_9BACT|nr:hypothetical protein [Neolewinella marina]NJB85318.1 hypothetical protein [Neolewinella marina]PHK99566.1 hypothetical protein CGL56_00480 [Neolewinella marina]